ncbi:hypothetical protein EVAR_70086_1 [Eumeta japonica]|uniref:Uncharacterized protein n=1 Tax=Eumeta variegata TaxID=151549 RepID=A0A4C1SGI4_EUMVA|nr:hypothetical protein EVAR_70086_1 [Eumeta japonica]
MFDERDVSDLSNYHKLAIFTCEPLKSSSGNFPISLSDQLDGAVVLCERWLGGQEHSHRTSRFDTGFQLGVLCPMAKHF